MRVLLLGNKVNLHWPCTILVIWMAVIAYSSYTNKTEVGVAVYICDSDVPDFIQGQYTP